MWKVEKGPTFQEKQKKNPHFLSLRGVNRLTVEEGAQGEIQELRGDMGQEGNEEQTGRAWEEMEEGNFILWHWKLPVTDTKATPEAAKNWVSTTERYHQGPNRLQEVTQNTKEDSDLKIQIDLYFPDG